MRDSPASTQIRLPWPLLGLLAALGLLVHLGGFVLVQLVPVKEAAQPYPEAFLQLATSQDGHTQSLLAEYAWLHDSEPLLLPTRWSASVTGALPRQVSGSGPGFGQYGPRLQEPHPPEGILPQSAPAIERPSDLLSLRPSWLHGVFQATDRQRNALPARLAQWEIRSSGSPQRLRAGIIPPPEASDAALPDFWPPATFLARAYASGLPLRLSLWQSSGNSELDEHLRQRLLNTAEFLRLEPGEYFISAGP